MPRSPQPDIPVESEAGAGCGKSWNPNGKTARPHETENGRSKDRGQWASSLHSSDKSRRMPACCMKDNSSRPKRLRVMPWLALQWPLFLQSQIAWLPISILTGCSRRRRLVRFTVAAEQDRLIVSFSWTESRLFLVLLPSGPQEEAVSGDHAAHRCRLGAIVGN